MQEAEYCFQTLQVLLQKQGLQDLNLQVAYQVLLVVLLP